MKAYLSLGSNVGNRAEHFSAVIDILTENEPFRLSQVYETEPQGGVVQDDYWNLVIEIDTNATPGEMLARAHAAENARNRTRTERWGPRTLDVDVLLMGNVVSSDPDLTIPHPRMWERRFVLAPLRELAPDLVPAEVFESARGDVARLGTLSSLC